MWAIFLCVIYDFMSAAKLERKRSEAGAKLERKYAYMRKIGKNMFLRRKFLSFAESFW